MRDHKNLARLILFLLTLACGLAVSHWLLAQEDDARRDEWQRPAEVMDELGIRDGSTVADVGAGRGYFTFKLAARVGPRGKVYAVDIDEERVTRIRRRAEKEGLGQIVAIRGATDDPNLPSDALDGILVVNTYHEMREYDAMLLAMYRALKPGGRLGIIDDEAQPGKPRSRYFENHEMPEETVREDAERNGFRLLRRPNGFRTTDGENWYFLVFEKPAAPAT